MNILLYGVQGAGKSTVGRYLASKLGVPFIATGDVFRQMREEDSDEGRLIRNLIDKGNFVPDDLTMKIVNGRLEQDDVTKGFILDGAPRNLVQERLFQKRPDLIVLVELSEQEAIKRLMERGRNDDTQEAIKKRLDWHKANTVPLIEFYKKQGIKVIEVNNTPAEEEVQKKLDELLKDIARN